jgi:protein lysine acetyltransferase
MNATEERKGRLEALRGLELFSDCSWDELAAIDALGTELSVKPGKRLTKEGLGALEFFIITNGRAAVSQGGRVVSSLERGAFFGEVALLFDALRTATVTAETAMKVTLLHCGEFAALMQMAPSVRNKIMQAAKDRAGAGARTAIQPVETIARKLGRAILRPA